MITLITCGGTIDKVYFDQESDYKLGESHIPSLLKGFGIEFNHIPLFRKDSLEMTNEDRELIYQTIEDIVDCNDILITHGTDTMIETARYLKDKFIEKRIVLTGAMSPFLFKNSDAEFNVGYALGVLKTGISHSVQIAMHGNTYFPYSNLRKDRENKRFYYLKNT